MVVTRSVVDDDSLRLPLINSRTRSLYGAGARKQHSCIYVQEDPKETWTIEPDYYNGHGVCPRRVDTAEKT